MQAAATIDFNGLVHVEHSSPGPGSEMHTSGSLQLRQDMLLTAGTSFIETDRVLLRHNATDPYELVCQTLCLVMTDLFTNAWLLVILGICRVP